MDGDVPYSPRLSLPAPPSRRSENSSGKTKQFQRKEPPSEKADMLPGHPTVNSTSGHTLVTQRELPVAFGACLSL